MCEAYKIELFKRFPMAEWKGEKFAPEQIALNEIALAGTKSGGIQKLFIYVNI